MAKYSFEFKLKIVQNYLEGKGGLPYLSKKYGVKSKKQVEDWLNAYHEFGEEGLLRKRQNQSYPVQFKMDAIELYQSTELSYRKVANHLGINNPALITNWMRIFRAEGIDGLSKTKESIARIIDSLRGSFKLVELLETLKFPKSTFMYWQKRFDRENPDQEIEEEMLKIRRHHKDYGCLRMTKELGNRGFHVNRKKVQRLIRKLSIEVRSFTRKSRRYHSYRGKIGTLAKNRMHRRFYTNVCHQKITTDTTELKYFEPDNSSIIREKKLYLDPFLDMYNSEIISYRISEKPNSLAIMEALEEAIQVTDDCIYRRTFHSDSDQGWAYQMKAYNYKLKEHKIFQSMSRKGTCLDNSIMENFFSLLREYYSFEELKQAIDGYIHYYNYERMKGKLNWQSPVQFREAALKAA